MFSKKKINRIMIVLVVLGIMLGAEVAFAQSGLDFTLDPNFGSVNLRAGFSPDPYTKAFTSGGDVDIASYLTGPDCEGYATSAPDFRVNWTGNSQRLSFFFISDGDTTMVINEPDGDWYCADDTGNTFHPDLTFRSPEEGQYDIWIGSFDSDDFVNGTLYVTEGSLDPNSFENSSTNSASSSSPRLDIHLEPNYGTVHLDAGFSADPYMRNITSGGEIDVDYLDGYICKGFATAEPDLRINWEGEGTQLSFFFMASEDTTLIVNDPYGVWHCADDFSGDVNPYLTFGSPPTGHYDIWIGSYNSGDYIDGRLYITELGLTPDDY